MDAVAADRQLPQQGAELDAAGRKQEGTKGDVAAAAANGVVVP